MTVSQYEWYKQLEATFELHKSWGTSDNEIEGVKVTDCFKINQISHFLIL